MNSKRKAQTAYWQAVKTLQAHVKDETARLRTIPDDNPGKLAEIENYYKTLDGLEVKAQTAWDKVQRIIEDELTRLNITEVNRN